MDPTKLAHVFQALAEEYGSQVKAAAAIDLSQPMFWMRAHARGGPHITDRVYLRLHRLCSRRVTRAAGARDARAFNWWVALRNDLQAAVTSPEGLKLINAKWSPWWDAQWGGWETNPLHVLRVEQEGGPDPTLLSLDPADEPLHRLMRALLQRGLLSHLQPFASLVESCGHAIDQIRAQLAFHQALDPLLNGERTGGIERGWEEMTDAELTRYLKAAYTCTAILLERESVLARAAKVARRDQQAPQPRAQRRKSPRKKSKARATKKR
jgi:hypothetical protein